MKLTKNIGLTDRMIRVILAVALLLLSYAGIPGGTTGILFACLSGILMVTSIAGSCLIYLPFRIRTTGK